MTSTSIQVLPHSCYFRRFPKPFDCSRRPAMRSPETRDEYASFLARYLCGSSLDRCARGQIFNSSQADFRNTYRSTPYDIATACRVIQAPVRSVFGGPWTVGALSCVRSVLLSCPAGALSALGPRIVYVVSRSASSPCAQPVRAPAWWS